MKCIGAETTREREKEEESLKTIRATLCLCTHRESSFMDEFS